MAMQLPPGFQQYILPPMEFVLRSAGLRDKRMVAHSDMPEVLASWYLGPGKVGIESWGADFKKSNPHINWRFWDGSYAGTVRAGYVAGKTITIPGYWNPTQKSIPPYVMVKPQGQPSPTPTIPGDINEGLIWISSPMGGCYIESEFDQSNMDHSPIVWQFWAMLLSWGGDVGYKSDSIHSNTNFPDDWPVIQKIIFANSLKQAGFPYASACLFKKIYG